MSLDPRMEIKLPPPDRPTIPRDRLMERARKTLKSEDTAIERLTSRIAMEGFERLSDLDTPEAKAGLYAYAQALRRAAEILDAAQ